MNLFQQTFLRPLWILCLILGANAAVHAHDPGLSSAEVHLTEAGPVVRLSFATSDIGRLSTIDTNRDGDTTPEEFAAAQLKLEELASHSFELSLNEERLPAQVTAAYEKASNAVRFELRFSSAGGSSDLHLRSAILQSLPSGHKQYFSLKDGHGRILAERILELGSDQFDINTDRSVAGDATRSFFLLGVEHILTGFDHLAFLLALLIAGTSIREAGKLITSFTLAHSVTLALATFDLVQVPSGVVEPLIAVSIIYVGVENLFQREMKRRWLLTFAFGLIHGLGFASVLRDLGIGGEAREALVPLLLFNLGVESGQIVMAALLLPLIWKLCERSAFALRYVSVSSLAIALLGCYWLVDRMLLR